MLKEVKNANFSSGEKNIRFRFIKNKEEDVPKNKNIQSIKIFKNFLQDIYGINDKTFVLLFDIEENKVIARNTNMTDTLFQECISHFDIDQIFDFDRDDILNKTKGNSIVFVIYNIKSFLKMLDLVAKTNDDVTLNLIDIETIKNVSILDNEQFFTSFKKLILTTEIGDKVNNTFRVSSISANITRILNELDKDTLINNIELIGKSSISFSLSEKEVDYLKEIVNITDNNTGILFDFRLNGNEKLDLYISDDLLNCKFKEDIEISETVLDVIKSKSGNYTTQIIIDKKNMFDFVLSMISFKDDSDLKIDGIISNEDSNFLKLVTSYISKSGSKSYYVLTSEMVEGI